MGLFNKFSEKVQHGGRSKGHDYSLNEVLAILDMANNDVPKDKIAELTGRTKDSLNYKIFEGQTTIKGKTNVRSIKRYWYVDPKDKNSEYVDENVALTRLFEAFGEEFVDTADVEARIATYCGERGIDLGEAPTEQSA